MAEQNIIVETYSIPKMLGIKELSKEFHIPAAAIRQWINSGQLYTESNTKCKATRIKPIY